MNIQLIAGRSRMLDLWIGVAIGAFIASAVTLLLTPQSGKNTRHMIADRASKAGDAIIWHARNEAYIAQHKHDKPPKK